MSGSEHPVTLKSVRSLKTANILTVILVTDMSGANWLYMGYKIIGKLKFYLAVIWTLMLIALTTIFDTGAYLGWAFVWVFWTFCMVVWWIVDLVLILSGRIKIK